MGTNCLQKSFRSVTNSCSYGTIEKRYRLVRGHSEFSTTTTTVLFKHRLVSCGAIIDYNDTRKISPKCLTRIAHNIYPETKPRSKPTPTLKPSPLPPNPSSESKSLSSTFTPETYFQSTSPESLLTSTLKPNTYPKYTSPEFLLISTLTPEVFLKVPSPNPYLLPPWQQNFILKALQLNPCQRSQTLKSYGLAISHRSPCQHPSDTQATSKTASQRLPVKSTVMQESLPKPEIPDRILVHSRIVIEGGTGINPLIIWCLINPPNT